MRVSLEKYTYPKRGKKKVTPWKVTPWKKSALTASALYYLMVVWSALLGVACMGEGGCRLP